MLLESVWSIFLLLTISPTTGAVADTADSGDNDDVGATAADDGCVVGQDRSSLASQPPILSARAPIWASKAKVNSPSRVPTVNKPINGSIDSNVLNDKFQSRYLIVLISNANNSHSQ